MEKNPRTRSLAAKGLAIDTVKFVVFLNGPIGVGKTTLGQAVAAVKNGGFIDRDDRTD